MFHLLFQLYVVQLSGGIDIVSVLIWQNWDCGTLISSNAFSWAVNAAKLAQSHAIGKYKRQLQERLQQGSNDQVWWHTIKSISGICASLTRSAPDVEDLGNFFASKFTLKDGFEGSWLDSVDSVTYPKRSWRIKLSKVRSVLCGLDVTKAVGPGGVGPHFLKNCCSEICHPLLLLFRCILLTATIPTSRISYWSFFLSISVSASHFSTIIWACNQFSTL